MNLDDYFVATVQLISTISMPFLGGAVIIGLIIALLQTLTQIQEQTLPQVVKIMFFVAIGLLSMGAVGGAFADFMVSILDAIVHV